MQRRSLSSTSKLAILIWIVQNLQCEVVPGLIVLVMFLDLWYWSCADVWKVQNIRCEVVPGHLVLIVHRWTCEGDKRAISIHQRICFLAVLELLWISGLSRQEISHSQGGVSKNVS